MVTDSTLPLPLPVRPLLLRFRALTLISLALFVSFLAGCSRESSYVIPRQASAREQFEFAKLQERKFVSPFRKASKSEDFLETIAAFEKVTKEFPNDTFYSSHAQLHIAIALDTNGEKSKAMRIYRTLMKQYPDDAEIQLSSLYGAGVIYDQRKQYAKAQDCFSEIIKRFGNRKEPMFREIVRRAQMQTQVVRKR